mmetsp:Transcript_22707/g.73227  ORF Transcript_22707/g.73227 Transcript_22707/m.73227 type:complete len:261 (+) Transcript_22707:2219-3001(+)
MPGTQAASRSRAPSSLSLSGESSAGGNCDRRRAAESKCCDSTLASAHGAGMAERAMICRTTTSTDSFAKRRRVAETLARGSTAQTNGALLELCMDKGERRQSEAAESNRPLGSTAGQKAIALSSARHLVASSSSQGPNRPTVPKLCSRYLISRSAHATRSASGRSRSFSIICASATQSAQLRPGFSPHAMPASVVAASEAPSCAVLLPTTPSCHFARASDGANAADSLTVAPPLVSTHGTSASSPRHSPCSAELKGACPA